MKSCTPKEWGPSQFWEAPLSSPQCFLFWLFSCLTLWKALILTHSLEVKVIKTIPPILECVLKDWVNQSSITQVHPQQAGAWGVSETHFCIIPAAESQSPGGETGNMHWNKFSMWFFFISSKIPPRAASYRGCPLLGLMDVGLWLCT